jgi:hypothetical protein
MVFFNGYIVKMKDLASFYLLGWFVYFCSFCSCDWLVDLLWTQLNGNW